MDPVSGEVTGFEELIGLHGGLGGWQTRPFILVPAGLQLSGAPLVGAPSLYCQLRAWQETPEHRLGTSARPAADEGPS